jgi:hypothetical protein
MMTLLLAALAGSVVMGEVGHAGSGMMVEGSGVPPAFEMFSDAPSGDPSGICSRVCIEGPGECLEGDHKVMAAGSGVATADEAHVCQSKFDHGECDAHECMTEEEFLAVVESALALDMSKLLAEYADHAFVDLESRSVNVTNCSGAIVLQSPLSATAIAEWQALQQ